MKFLFVLTVFYILYGCSSGQWASWGGQGPISTSSKYFMDSAAECNRPGVIGIGTDPVTIYGRTPVQAAPTTITECKITLQSDKVGEKRAFMVEIVNGNIQNVGVQFSMYDGSDTTVNRLFSLERGSTVDTSKRYMTSGGFVTFYLKKTSPSDLDFNIEVIVRVVPAGITNQNECKTGNEYGCIAYGYIQPVDKETIIGIVGGVFGLIVFIVIPIIVICCYRRSKGVNKKWDEFKLSDKANTATDIHNSSGSLSKVKREPWTSQSSRAPYSDYKKSVASRSRYSDGEDSVFSGSTDLPPKQRPPPPPYDEQDRGRSYRDGPRGYRNERDDRSNRNDRYDNKGDRDYRSDRNYRLRRDSDMREPSQKSYRSSSDDASFVQSRDDHPQEVFIERVIEPRVKPQTKADLQKRANYEDEDPYDKIVERESPKIKSTKELKESAMQCDEDSSEDNESNTESDVEPVTEETDEEDIIKKKEKEAKKSALYAQPSKIKQIPDQAPPAPVQTVQYPPPPGGIHMVPGQPVVYTAQTNGPQMFQRPVYPLQQPWINQQPHVRPLMSMSGIPPQPVMIHGYSQPPMSVRMPPPIQTQNPAPHMYTASQPPQQPPVFTHLVQRGYGRQSPSLDGSEGRNQTDDSNMAADLASGVEFMKRTTTTV